MLSFKESKALIIEHEELSKVLDGLVDDKKHIEEDIVKTTRRIAEIEACFGVSKPKKEVVEPEISEEMSEPVEEVAPEAPEKAHEEAKSVSPYRIKGAK